MQVKIFFSSIFIFLFLGPGSFTGSLIYADTLEESYAPLPDLNNTSNLIKPDSAITSTTSATTVPNNTISPLTTELLRYQKVINDPWEEIPVCKLKFGIKSQNVFLLKQRLMLTGDLESSNQMSNRFDEDLEEAVKKFQERHGLSVDGVVGPATRKELNVQPQLRVKQIQVNLDRLQKLSSEIGERYIIVNVPEMAMHLFDNGEEVLNMKAIVGKPMNATPELVSKITRVVFYPYWNVPGRIAANDIVPKALSDPYYLDDMHIKVYINRGDGFQQINHQDIDWARVQYEENNPYQFRQEPGEQNSLGIVKFEFPNRYHVYLHDTPAKTLFEATDRALSHGCVRLERPFDLVTYLLKDDPKWDSDQVQTVINNHKTTYVELHKPIKIFITYLTVWADQNGTVNYRDDIYHLDFPDENTITNPDPEPEENFY